MAITSVADYEKCLASSQAYTFSKTLNGSTPTGSPFDGSRIGGYPAIDSNLPGGSTIVLTNLVTGFIPFQDVPTPLTNYLVSMSMQTNSSPNPFVSLNDKLMWSSFVSGTAATTTFTDLDASRWELAARIGASDFSDLQWYLEPTANITAAGLVTINVTLNDSSTLNIVISIPILSLGKMLPLLPLNAPGKFIKKVNTAFVNTTTSGVVGIVCSRAIAESVLGQYELAPSGPTAIGLPPIPNEAALYLQNWSTSTVVMNGTIRIGSA